MSMTSDQYRNLQLSDEPWCCPTCYKEAIPFHDYSNISTLSATTTLVESFPPSFVNKRNEISCKFLNARSIVNKRNDLQTLLECDQLDVLAVAETFLPS